MSKDPQIVFALIVPLFPEKYSVLFLLSKSLMCLINQHLSLTFKFNEFYEFYEFNEFNEFWFGTSLKPKLWQKKFALLIIISITKELSMLLLFII